MTDPTPEAFAKARAICTKQLGKYGPGSSMESEIALALDEARREGAAAERERFCNIDQSTALADLTIEEVDRTLDIARKLVATATRVRPD